MWHFIILKFINIIIIVIILRALSDLSTPSNAFTMRVAKKFSGRGKNTRKLPYFLFSVIVVSIFVHALKFVVFRVIIKCGILLF